MNINELLDNNVDESIRLTENLFKVNKNKLPSNLDVIDGIININNIKIFYNINSYDPNNNLNLFYSDIFLKKYFNSYFVWLLFPADEICLIIPFKKIYLIEPHSLWNDENNNLIKPKIIKSKVWDNKLRSAKSTPQITILKTSIYSIFINNNLFSTLS